MQLFLRTFYRVSKESADCATNSPVYCNASSSSDASGDFWKKAKGSWCCCLTSTIRKNRRKTKQVLTSARDRAMQLAADICNTSAFPQEVPTLAKSKGISPSSSEEGRSTDFAGSRESRCWDIFQHCSHTNVCLPSCFRLTYKSILCFQTANHTGNSGYWMHRKTSFKRKVLYLKLFIYYLQHDTERACFD